MSAPTLTRTQQQDLLAPRDESSLPALPGELVNRIREEIESEPRTISVLAASDVKQAEAAARALQEAAIRLTFASDWIIFEAKDGARLGYLQDAGCQRVRALWGIDFSRCSPRDDLEESTTPDGHFCVEAYVEGHCKLTGETIQEFGWRSSMGLFEKAWAEATKDELHVTIAKLKADVKKSAIANAQGRIVRRATGLSQVPAEKLCQLLGVAPDKLRGFKFRSGTQGGGSSSTSDASEAQVNLIVNEAVRGKKVAGATDLGVIRGFVEQARLTKQTASKVIETLKAAKERGVSSDQFLALIGVAQGAPAEEE